MPIERPNKVKGHATPRVIAVAGINEEEAKDQIRLALRRSHSYSINNLSITFETEESPAPQDLLERAVRENTRFREYYQQKSRSPRVTDDAEMEETPFLEIEEEETTHTVITVSFDFNGSQLYVNNSLHILDMSIDGAIVVTEADAGTEWNFKPTATPRTAKGLALDGWEYIGDHHSPLMEVASRNMAGMDDEIMYPDSFEHGRLYKQIQAEYEDKYGEGNVMLGDAIVPRTGGNHGRVSIWVKKADEEV